MAEPRRNSRIGGRAGSAAGDGASPSEKSVLGGGTSPGEDRDPSAEPERPAAGESTLDAALDDDLARAVRVIEERGEFDRDVYLAQVEGALSPSDAVRHYVAVGEARGLRPNDSFDPAFYIRVYHDVAAAGVNAFAHYLRSGVRERRYPSPSAYAADAEEILAAEAFDADYYRTTYPGVDFTAMKPLEHYLLIGQRRGMQPNEAFDGDFYQEHHDDARSFDRIPLVHWIREGRKRGYATSLQQIEKNVSIVQDSELFDPAYYRQAQDLPASVDPAVHYTLHATTTWADPGPRFSTEYYLRRNGDLQRAKINPLVHFESYGRKEKRPGQPPQHRAVFRRGKVRHDFTRPTLLLLLHEASRTGAPLLGLALARELSQRWNVMVWSGKPGVLDEDLEACSTLVGQGFFESVDNEFILRDLLQEYSIDAVIANSVETSAVHPAILACGLPSVGLIHEFASYSKPFGKITETLSRLDRCVVPANLVAESAQEEVTSICGSRASNLVVRPQGHLPQDLWEDTLFAAGDDDGGWREQVTRRVNGKRVVLGAGFVHIRKGVDLFVEVAKWVRELTDEPVHFVWIGDGWNPRSDFNLGLWVDDSLSRWGLQDDVTFISAQNTIDWAFDLADVFLLSSRLDPFPNVAVDAIAANVPVVCFEGTTGIAEFLSTTGAAGEVASYLDTRAAAEAVVRQLASGEVDNGGVLRDELDFATYVAALEVELEHAAEAVRRRADQVAALKSAEVFDQRFHETRWRHYPSDRMALNEYVARATKGIHRYAPLPGFSDGVWAAAHEVPEGQVPLLAALEAAPGETPRTHRVITVEADDDSDGASGLSDLSVGLHLHLFYADLADEVEELLERSRLKADLFVSCSGDVQAKEISYQLRRYNGGSVDIRVVPNVGRDIAPFITEFGKDLTTGAYDVVGHLHGKRSKEIGTGDDWRRFLWGHLLGGQGAWEAIAGAFTEDASLGMVFPEDHHLVGWAKNRTHGEWVRQRLGLATEIPAAPVFPLGTMFWARPAALRPLWDANLTWDDYPPEPLPYDGSILHAIERLLPTICEETGHQWATIHLPEVTW